MATNRTTSTRSTRRAPLGAILSAALVALASLPAIGAISTTTPAQAAVTDTASGSYGWPVKPFDRAHPIRGNFGDPRTVFHAPPTTAGLLTGGGSFQFHRGIDIAAPNGTAVYPVADGVVSFVNREWIEVNSGNGSAFEYWHVRARVKLGQRVTARVTVLGRVKSPAEHVHLTQVENRRAVNPLAPGRLTPYEDVTVPEIGSISFRRTETGRDELPHFLRGRLHIVVEATDLPSVAVPGVWNGLPVTPSRISWRVQRWTGKVVLRERVARDVASTVPVNGEFWVYYARGTYQNMAVFRPHYSYLQRGSYQFKLTRGPFDTRTLRDGIYDLVVTASDSRGNSSSRTMRFTVHNRAGWTGAGS